MTRKDFLQTVAGAAAATAAGAPALAAASKPPLKLGAHFILYKTAVLAGVASLEDCIAEMSDIGATGVELQGEVYVPNFPNPPASWVKQWFGWMEKYHVEPTSMAGYLETAPPPGGRSVQDHVRLMTRNLEIANRLGFKVVRTKWGFLTRQDKMGQATEEALERALPAAEKYNVKIAFEVHAPTNFRWNGPKYWVELIRKWNSPYVGFLLDGSIFSTGARPGGRVGKIAAEPPEDVIPILPYVYHVHAKFHGMQEDPTTGSITDPVTPYEKVLPVLLKNGYTGYFSSEYEGPREAFQMFAQVRLQHIMFRRIYDQIQW